MKSTLAWAAVVVLATTLLLAIGAQATQEQVSRREEWDAQRTR